VQVSDYFECHAVSLNTAPCLTGEARLRHGIVKRTGSGHACCRPKRRSPEGRSDPKPCRSLGRGSGRGRRRPGARGRRRAGARGRGESTIRGGRSMVPASEVLPRVPPVVRTPRSWRSASLTPGRSGFAWAPDHDRPPSPPTSRSRPPMSSAAPPATANPLMQIAPPSLQRDGLCEHTRRRYRNFSPAPARVAQPLYLRGLSPSISLEIHSGGRCRNDRFCNISGGGRDRLRLRSCFHS